jgi:hypothetical protein
MRRPSLRLFAFAALAAGVASNATLAAGFTLTGAATAYWVLRRAGSGPRRASLSLLVAVGVAGALHLDDEARRGRAGAGAQHD